MDKIVKLLIIIYSNTIFCAEEKDVDAELAAPEQQEQNQQQHDNENKQCGQSQLVRSVLVIADSEPQQTPLRRSTRQRRPPVHFLWSEDHIIQSKICMLGRRRKR